MHAAVARPDVKLADLTALGSAYGSLSYHGRVPRSVILRHQASITEPGDIQAGRGPGAAFVSWDKVMPPRGLAPRAYCSRAILPLLCRGHRQQSPHSSRATLCRVLGGHCSWPQPQVDRRRRRLWHGGWGQDGDEVPGPAGQVLIGRPVLAGYLAASGPPGVPAASSCTHSGLMSSSIAIRAPLWTSASARSAGIVDRLAA